MSRPPVTNLVPPAGLAAEAGAEECRAEVDGIGIRYLRAGSGPPLLLLHGLMGYSFSWRKNIAALAGVATVYAPDFPGTGYSDRIPMDCSFGGIARLMLKYMDALGLRDATVLGTSHGGAVATMMAALDQEEGGARIARLALVSSVNPYSARGRKRIAFFSSSFGAWLLLRGRVLLTKSHGFFISMMYGDSSRISPGTAEGYAAPLSIDGTLEHILARVKCWNNDLRLLRDALPKIGGIPTLLLWGNRDRAVPISSLEPLSKHFAHARTVVIDTAGHLPYEELPEEFNRVLIDFLRHDSAKH